MNELLRNSKITRRIIINFSLTMFICISSILLMYVFNKIEHNSEQLAKSIETQWRDYTKLTLSGFEKELLEEVNNSKLDPYNDTELNAWIVNNLPFLKSDSMVDNFAVVNVGYRVRDNSIDLELSFLDNAGSEVKEKVEKSYKSILIDIGGKDVKYIMGRIMDEAHRINNDLPYIKTSTIVDLYTDALLLNENTLGSSNITQSNVEELSKSSKYWTESITIPNGILGFDSQPPYINNETNPIYRKVIIYVSVDKDSIMKNYDIYYNNTRQLANISIVILIIMSLVCIVIIAILFIDTINMNGGVYDADNAHENSCSCNDGDIHIGNTRTK